MNAVRIGVIGLGNIGRHHASYLHESKVPNATLSAVATSDPKKAAAFPGIKVFGDARQLINSREVDAVIIATPHPEHTRIGIAALRAGIHIMVEKPIAAQKSEAQLLVSVSREHPELVFGVMLQLRVEPRYTLIRELLGSSALGTLQRVSWIMTDWFRTEAYYSSGGWRASWAGEGGGVLLNQAMHNLDTLQWLLGMPKAVRGFCGLGRFHDVEVEDDVTAYLEYSNGVTGTIVATTGEAPGTNRLEITGSRGKLLLEADNLWLTTIQTDAREFSQNSTASFAKPESDTREIPLTNAAAPHATMTGNWVNAITQGEKLLAPGPEGVNAVELANAILLSHCSQSTVQLPMDAAAYDATLNRLIKESRPRARPIRTAKDDISSSFRR